MVDNTRLLKTISDLRLSGVDLSHPIAPPAPDWERLYRQMAHRCLAERNARMQDRQHANQVVRQLRLDLASITAERDTLKASYRDLLAALDRRDTRKRTNKLVTSQDVPDLDSMTPEQQHAWITANINLIQPKKG
jgi:hypothetical protein